MKKILLIEVLVLIVLLIVAVAVCVNISNREPKPEVQQEQPILEQTTEPSTEVITEPEETTEPEPTWMSVPANRQLLAQQYFVYDVNNDTFVTSSASADTRVYPASITKLFTAYVSLQYLEPDRSITVGSDVLEKVEWGSSVAYLGAGDTLSVEQLVEAMLLPSGNDAAYVLAVEVSRVMNNNPSQDASSAVSSFMTEMNRQAQALGMTGSHFVNPDGIHSDNHYMSYIDLCLLGKLALQNETIMKYANTASEIVYLPSQVTNPLPESSSDYTPGLEAGQLRWKNTNELIQPESEYYCPYAIGLKTGKTPGAGACLLSAFEKDGQQWIIGVFKCPENDDRFDDTIQLFNETIGR